MFYINYWTVTYQFCLLEPRALKEARVVLRGEGNSNIPDLPDISGKDGSGEDIMLAQKLEWTPDGVLKELSDKSKITDGGDEYEYESTVKLKSFTISGFSLGFFSIAMLLGVTSLLLLRKRTN